nr:hypothetical protein [Tanacetum cinerariifolium]
MVVILEKTEHNADFHPMVDFIEASPLRYALTVKPNVYVSHIRQFWSTARIETMEEGTQILATVNGIHRTVTESSLRRNIKLQDEEGISSLPDTELFENITLMGYNISPNQKFTFQKCQFSYQWNPSFSGRIVPLFNTMLVQHGEGSGTPTEPHHTPYPEDLSPSHATYTSPTLPPVTTTSIPTVTLTKTTTIRQYTQRAWIAQSSALPTTADEPDSPLRDVSQGEACPTDSGFIADQDRATIAKPSTLPYDSEPRVTFPAAVEGSMQQTILELTALCTSLQRQLSKLTAKLQAQEVEINRLKDRVKLLEDREGVAATRSGVDAPIKGRTTVLASGVVDVPTGSGSIPTASTPAEEQVPTGSDVVPTASPVFATGSDVVPTDSPVFSIATVVTPYKRRKSKEVMVEFETPKKQKVQEQIDAQVARELEEQLERGSEKVKDFRGMTFEEVEAKFNLVWKQMEDFIPIGSKEEAERIKRKGLNLEQEIAKKQKTSEEVPEEAMSPEEVPKEKIKEMMQLVPIKEVYVEALQGRVESTMKIGQRNLHASGEGLPSMEGSSTCDDQLQASSGNYSQMANDLILKIYKIANSPRQQ